MASKKPSAPPPPRLPRRDTMEVEATWLETDDAPSAPKGASTKPPPLGGSAPPKRLSKAAMPRLSGHVPRQTLEVQADWLEVDQPALAASRKQSLPGMAATRASRPAIPRASRAGGPPTLPPSAPPEAVQKRPRQAWEPPTLPPPPPTAARSRRALPPPLPRGEEEDALERPASRRPPRR